MRISTQMLFESGAARIGEAQSGLVKTQQQVSSGRRILAPSDDPAGAARALEVTQAQSMNTQFGANRVNAINSLSTLDGTLSGVTSLLQDAKDAAITAGGPLLGDAERASIATELKGRLNQLLGLANSRDVLGNYVFSGFQTNTPAFVQTATGALYQGDAGQRLVQVDSARQMAVNNPGDSVFQGGGQDVFKTLTDLITQLATPGTAGLDTALASAKGNLDLALNNVLTVRASVGTRLQELDALDNAGTDRNLQYSQELSQLQDLDYTQALTKLTQQQTTLEAAQQSFVKIASLSLFNYL